MCRGSKSLLPTLDHREIVPCRGVLWVASEGLSATGLGARQVAECREYQRAIRVHMCRGPARRNDSIDEFECAALVAALVAKHAEHVHGVGVAGINRIDF